MDEILNEEIFATVVQRQRRDKAIGADGWNGILLKWAPLWMQRRYLLALREVAVSHEFPDKWDVCLITMIPKRDKDPTVFSKNRDIWVSSHGWGIMTGCLQKAYERAQEKIMVPASYGFRARRGAAAVVLTTRLLTEAAAATGAEVTRWWVDLKNFFMGVNRVYQYKVERTLGVEGGVTGVARPPPLHGECCG